LLVNHLRNRLTGGALVAVFRILQMLNDHFLALTARNVQRFNYDYITGSIGNAALMAFTKVVAINSGPVATDRHVYLMKTRARNELGDENRYRELMTDLPLGRAARPPRNSRHGRLSGI
jgi:hypothetical protein